MTKEKNSVFYMELEEACKILEEGIFHSLNGKGVGRFRRVGCEVEERKQGSIPVFRITITVGDS